MRVNPYVALLTIGIVLILITLAIFAFLVLSPVSGDRKSVV